MPERSDLPVIAKPWLMYLREFPKEVLVPPRCFAGLKGGRRIRRGESPYNVLDGSVIHGTKDLLPLKPTHQSPRRTNLCLSCRVDVPYVVIPDLLAAWKETQSLGGEFF